MPFLQHGRPQAAEGRSGLAARLGCRLRARRGHRSSGVTMIYFRSSELRKWIPTLAPSVAASATARGLMHFLLGAATGAAAVAVAIHLRPLFRRHRAGAGPPVVHTAEEWGALQASRLPASGLYCFYSSATGAITTRQVRAPRLGSWVRLQRRHHLHQGPRSQTVRLARLTPACLPSPQELMTVPIDDHAIVRGHACFDTASLVGGRLYRLRIHLERLIASAASARLPLPYAGDAEANIAKMTSVIKATCAASGKADADVRYWLTAGTGNLGLTPTGCQPGFYVLVRKPPRTHTLPPQPPPPRFKLDASPECTFHLLLRMHPALSPAMVHMEAPTHPPRLKAPL